MLMFMGEGVDILEMVQRAELRAKLDELLRRFGGDHQRLTQWKAQHMLDSDGKSEGERLEAWGRKATVAIVREAV